MRWFYLGIFVMNEDQVKQTALKLEALRNEVEALQKQKFDGEKSVRQSNALNRYADALEAAYYAVDEAINNLSTVCQ
jgi:hypothetical protein